jgi:hypothetical protein
MGDKTLSGQAEVSFGQQAGEAAGLSVFTFSLGRDNNADIGLSNWQLRFNSVFTGRSNPILSYIHF